MRNKLLGGTTGERKSTVRLERRVGQQSGTEMRAVWTWVLVAEVRKERGLGYISEKGRMGHAHPLDERVHKRDDW